MTDDDEARRLRAAERRARITIVRVADDSSTDREAVVRGAEAASLVTQLTRTAWSLSGQPWPTYDRADIPCKFFRG